ncbi:MAG: hypothetical protein ACI30S_08925 [Muribaculaceae bacterium]
MQINSRASVGKTYLNKSLTVKKSATDILNTANNDRTMNTSVFSLTNGKAMTDAASP